MDTETNIRQYRFTFDTVHGVFSDAINYTEAEWSASTLSQRRQAARARRDAWVAMMDGLKAPVVTKRALRAERIAIRQQQAADAARLAEVEALIEDASVPENGA